VAGVTYIGSETSGAGLALVGVRSISCAAKREDVWPLIEQARARGDLVLLGEAHAREVHEQLARFIDQEALPPVIVIGAIEDESAPRDPVVVRARAALGLPT